MKQRLFVMIGAAVATLTLPAQAQQAKAVRIGILNFENPEPLGAMLRVDDRGADDPLLRQILEHEQELAIDDRHLLGE